MALDARPPRLQDHLALCGIGVSKLRWFLYLLLALVSVGWRLQERLLVGISSPFSLPQQDAASKQNEIRYDPSDSVTGSRTRIVTNFSVNRGHASKEEFRARYPSSRFVRHNSPQLKEIKEEKKNDTKTLRPDAHVGKDNKSLLFDKIVLLGERHSGTSYTTRMLEKCFPDLAVSDFLVRYKHWFQPTPDYVINVTKTFLQDNDMTKEEDMHKIRDYWPKIASLEDPKSAFNKTLVIVMFRNVYDWLEDMRTGPHHWNNHFTLYRFEDAPAPDTEDNPTRYGVNYLPWKDFLAADMTIGNGNGFNETHLCQNAYPFGSVSPCRVSKELYPDQVKKDYRSDWSAMPDSLPFSGHNPIYELNVNGKPFHNPLELRTAKIRNFMDIPKSWDVGGFMTLQREDIFSKGSGFLLDQVSKIVGIEPSCGADPPKNQGMTVLDGDWVYWISQHADWEAEGMLGYKKRENVVDLFAGLKKKKNGTMDVTMQHFSSDTSITTLAGFRIHTAWHPQTRGERFPSVEERVKLYMSNWYSPPFCKKLSTFVEINWLPDSHMSSWPSLTMKNPWDSQSFQNKTYHSIVMPDMKFLLERQTVADCGRTLPQYRLEGKRPSENRIQNRRDVWRYCDADIIELMDMMDEIDSGDNFSTPLLVTFGDSEGFDADIFDVPFFAKHRAATTKENIDDAARHASDKGPTCLMEERHPLKTTHHLEVYQRRFSPIIWRLNYMRHFLPLQGAAQKDTPWERKKPLGFWRGEMTGPEPWGSTDVERCQMNQRCRFVLNHANSKYIDGGLTNHQGKLSRDTVNGTKVIKGEVETETIQAHKVIISMEGNDIASGLKWGLQSESVVLMSPPTRTSWAMEELLQPWIHYIPMFENGSNAEEMVRWVLDNDFEARRIAERATLFIYDFMYHPDAAKDERRVKEDIVRRYRALWY